MYSYYKCVVGCNARIRFCPDPRTWYTIIITCTLKPKTHSLTFHCSLAKRFAIEQEQRADLHSYVPTILACKSKPATNTLA